MSLPTAPSRTMSQDVFDATTDAFIGALPQFEVDMNALAAAMSLNATTDTSASSVAIGTGSKTFTVTAGKSFVPGMWLVIADSAAPTTNAMYAQVSSYSGTSLVVNSVGVQGSGTIASWQISQTFRADGVAQVQQLSDIPVGLTMSTPGASTTMTIGAGHALDSTRTLSLALSAAIAKTTAAWVVGTGNGGLMDAGAAPASTWQHFYEIRRPDTGVVDIGCTVLYPDPTAVLPTNYTQYRYIGSQFVNAAEYWEKYIQKGDEFIRDVPLGTDINTAVQGTSSINYTISTPLGISVKARLNGTMTHATATNSLKIFSPLISDTNAVSGGNCTAMAPTNGGYASYSTDVWTDTSSQVTAVASAANTTFTASVQSYFNPRGRNA